MTADLREPEAAAIPESREARSNRAAAAIGALPFVKDRGDGTGRDFWAVEPGADWQADYAKGRAYAALALGVMADHDGAHLLAWVGKAMRRTGRTEDGIASGFLSAMGREAIAGETLRRAAAAYAPDRAPVPADPLPGLWVEFQRLHRAYEAATHAPGGGEFDTPECKRIWAEMEAVEARLTATRPTSPEGIAAQLSYALHEGMADGVDTTGAARGMFDLILDALGGGGIALPVSPEAADPLPGMVEEWRAVAAEVNSGALSGLAAEVKAEHLLSLGATLQAMRPRSLAGAAALLRFAQEAEAIEDHTPEGCDIIGAVVDLIEAQAAPAAG
ncbi:hypothetical protein [Limimaricola cinnabarinus]|uniref:hypothetical protein n=1 Tax=Limimaricola cinnabarinus TaxID=1125964 RepID=UPI00249344C0|nr:hypothetical protein [Limimaricola cinnabarinus]